MDSQTLRVGIDIGGTFTDFVLYNPSNREIQTHKVLSTPDDPSRAVLQGLKRLIPSSNVDKVSIVHGSTVATNALLERKGAPTALITTRGFADILQIGRQNRPALYDLFADPRPALVPPAFRFEVTERVNSAGEILIPLDDSEIEELILTISALDVRSVAVCLLFSFLHPSHEQRIGDRFRKAGFLVSLSSEIVPEFREYERTSTTVVNAYVSPIMDHYLHGLTSGLPRGYDLRVMQSNGGSISPQEARQKAVTCILSGPAGGIVGCQYMGHQVHGSESTIAPENGNEPFCENDIVRFLTFDMGGTSTDVSLIDGQPRITTESTISDCPIKIPVLDIHTIGAGGGSLASVDAGGALRVGPSSAGAVPGPACYGKGLLPTVTDANLVLGRLQPEFFLGGTMPLDYSRACNSMETIANQLGLSIEEAALGIVSIANAHMERALRVISVEQGQDPRDYTLLSFGGAGGLHASDLARGLGIQTILVPLFASTLSAFGMLTADIIKDYAITVLLPEDTPVRVLEERLSILADQGFRALISEGMSPDNILIQRSVDMRYQGQSYEMNTPFSSSLRQGFIEKHSAEYGYAKDTTPIEFVTLRVRAVGKIPSLPSRPLPLQSPDPAHARIDERKVRFSQEWSSTPLYRSELLTPGNVIPGPAILIRPDTTILIDPNDIARVDPFGNITIKVGL